MPWSKKIRLAAGVFACALIVGLYPGVPRADEVLDPDTRFLLDLTPSERAEFLSEMRQMLVSIQGIIAGIGAGDRNKIATAARYSGNRMARATPDSVRAKLPQSFKDLGGPTHLMFEEIVIRSETDDMDALARLTAEAMQQCVACHGAFRVKR